MDFCCDDSIIPTEVTTINQRVNKYWDLTPSKLQPGHHTAAWCEQLLHFVFHKFIISITSLFSVNDNYVLLFHYTPCQITLCINLVWLYFTQYTLSVNEQWLFYYHVFGHLTPHSLICPMPRSFIVPRWFSPLIYCHSESRETTSVWYGMDSFYMLLCSDVINVR